VNVKCPNCKTRYNIPVEKLHKGPRKLRCYKCGNVFALAPRSMSLPEGYEEFHTSATSGEFPAEFTFLREKKEEGKRPSLDPSKYDHITDEEADVQPETAAEGTDKGQEADASGSPDPVSSAIRASGLNPDEPRSDVIQNVLESYQPPEQKEAVEPEPESSAPSEEDIQVEVQTQQAELPAGQSAVAQVAVPEAGLDHSPAVAGSLNAPAVIENAQQSQAYADSTWPVAQTGVPYASQPPAERSPQAWELEDPFDLEQFAIEESSPFARRMGQLFVFMFFVVIILGVFVAWRNSWSLSLGKLPEQTAHAFSQEQNAPGMELLRGLEATVTSVYLVEPDEGGKYLVVEGMLMSDAEGPRKGIWLKVLINNSASALIKEKASPLLKPPVGTPLRNASSSELSHMAGSVIPVNKVLDRGDETNFAVVVNPVPVGYDSGSKIEVTVLRAEAVP